jgi:hypothetical protein
LAARTETTTMKTYSHQHLDSADYVGSLIREDFERCHPGETLDDLKRRASFSRDGRGLLRDWMAVAAARAAAATRARGEREEATMRRHTCGLDRRIGNSQRSRCKPLRPRCRVAARPRYPIPRGHGASGSGRYRRRSAALPSVFSRSPRCVPRPPSHVAEPFAGGFTCAKHTHCRRQS